MNFRTTIRVFLLVGLFFLQNITPARGQKAFNKQESSSQLDEKIVKSIEVRLSQAGSNTSYSFILPMVRSHCGQDVHCLLRNYNNIMHKLEELFNLPAAIYVCDEIIKISHEHGEVEQEAQA
jgi:DNA phosphorothioation-dependent restriction protein DptG